MVSNESATAKVAFAAATRARLSPARLAVEPASEDGDGLSLAAAVNDRLAGASAGVEDTDGERG